MDMFDPSVHLVFDLDDTLYPEIDYARSALTFAGRLVEAAFAVDNAASFLLQTFDDGQRDAIGALWAARALPQAARIDVIAAMRGHRPAIDLPRASAETLTALALRGIKWSILTDGRSLTQRRKIEALGLTSASGIYISEERGVGKPTLKAYTQIVDDHSYAHGFCYIADNPAKDFVTPNALGWKTIMLRDRGQNIHPQEIDVPKVFRADVEINELNEILITDAT
jgi:putative hydrolase of the HAD superfamily